MEWIDYALNLFGQSWFGTLIGIVGLVAAVFTYLWTRRRTSMAYVHLGEHILGSASDSLPAEIDVQYSGISIPRLTKTTLIIWNSGENTVSGSDIVSKDPLRFAVGSDGRILAVSVLKTSRSVNDFVLVPPLERTTNEAKFTFDFLEANDGAVIEILHTSTNRKPRVEGTLKGLPKGFRNLGQFTRPKPQKKRSKGPFGILRPALPFIGVAAAGFLFAAFESQSTTFHLDRMSNILMPFMGGFAGMWAASWFVSRRRYPISLHMEALE